MIKRKGKGRYKDEIYVLVWVEASSEVEQKLYVDTSDFEFCTKEDLEEINRNESH